MMKHFMMTIIALFFFTNVQAQKITRSYDNVSMSEALRDLNEQSFIGTITSGPSVFIMKVRADESSVTAIDCPQAMFPDCLSLNIDDRATISHETIIKNAKSLEV